MTLAQAQRYAAAIVEWLTPHCERIEIAGSIRRGLPHCNDVDLVCIPKRETQRDMLGAIIADHNLLWVFLNDYVGSGKATFQTGGNQPGKFAILQLKACQLDVYFADQTNFATRFLCRTGSKEHNIWLAQRAQERGGKWEPYEGLNLPPSPPRSGRGNEGEVSLSLVPAATEADIYQALGLGFIEPANRESAWIKSNLEFGL